MTLFTEISSNQRPFVICESFSCFFNLPKFHEITFSAHFSKFRKFNSKFEPEKWLVLSQISVNFWILIEISSKHFTTFSFCLFWFIWEGPRSWALVTWSQPKSLEMRTLASDHVTFSSTITNKLLQNANQVQWKLWSDGLGKSVNSESIGVFERTMAAFIKKLLYKFAVTKVLLVLPHCDVLYEKAKVIKYFPTLANLDPQRYLFDFSHFGEELVNNSSCQFV